MPRQQGNRLRFEPDLLTPDPGSLLHTPHLRSQREQKLPSLISRGEAALPPWGKPRNCRGLCCRARLERGKRATLFNSRHLSCLTLGPALLFLSLTALTSDPAEHLAAHRDSPRPHQAASPPHYHPGLLQAQETKLKTAAIIGFGSGLRLSWTLGLKNVTGSLQLSILLSLHLVKPCGLPSGGFSPRGTKVPWQSQAHAALVP